VTALTDICFPLKDVLFLFAHFRAHNLQKQPQVKASASCCSKQSDQNDHVSFPHERFVSHQGCFSQQTNDSIFSLSMPSSSPPSACSTPCCASSLRSDISLKERTMLIVEEALRIVGDDLDFDDDDMR
jgi:hypothetical protein